MAPEGAIRQIKTATPAQIGVQSDHAKQYEEAQ
jgi:hypothetical protein